MARLIIRRQNGKHDKRETEYFAHDEESDFHTEQGVIPQSALKKGGEFILKGERFLILNPSFMDRYWRLGRGAQIVQPKDLGFVIAETGVSKDSIVLDIGAGSGFSAAIFARVAGEVHTYDINEKNLKRTKENMEALGLSNVVVGKGDAYKTEDFKEREIDLFFLDVPEPWRAIATAKKVLKSGAFLVAYSPCITQSMQTVEALDNSFIHLRTVEVMLREWKVQGRVVRPESKDFQHTAFLTFCRKV